MSLFAKKKIEKVEPESENTDIDSVAASVYKQNIEISGKNKTLSLLSKLYSISILTLTPKDLARKISGTMQVDLSLELAGIFLYEQAKSELKPLTFNISDRMKSSGQVHATFFDKNIVISRSAFLASTLQSKIITHTDNLENIWVKEVISSEHIRSSILCPLVIESKVIGMLILCLNRTYNDLVDYEKESIQSSVNVIAVALDKAILYEQLNILNKNLEKANDRLLDLDKQKTEFISFATHQLRAPLTAMKGYTSLILEGDLGAMPPEAHDAVQRISDSSTTLAAVVDDYLNVSRIELGTMKYSFARLDLKELVTSVLAELKPNIDGKTGVTFSFTSAPLTPPTTYMISGDRDKFKQVLANLIDNSLKYTPKGRIQVLLDRNGPAVRFTVTDNGVGIAPAVIPKLFSKFTRADNANSVNIHGTGLGLFVAKDVVLAHHGKIWAESKGEGMGSTFIVEIPAFSEVV